MTAKKPETNIETPAAPIAEAPAAPAAEKAAGKASPKAKKAPAPKKAPAAKPATAKIAPAKPAAPLKKAVPVKAPVASKPAKPAKAEKPKKAKLVRDSYTMPEDEYGQLAALKKRLLTKGVAAKKSELLRAGLALLAAQKDDELLAQLKKIPALKTGRPAK